MKKWKLGFEVLVICFVAVIWFAFYPEKQNEQEDQYPDNSERSEDDVEDKLIIVSSDDKSEEQEEETTEQDIWENAQQAYEEFVDGKRDACGMDMLELATPTGEPNRRYATQYIIIDSNGDGIPELHTRTWREFYTFTYRNGQMEILAGYFSNPTQYTLLKDGTFAYWNDGGNPRWDYFSCFRLDIDGNEIDRINFSWTDTNENNVRDDADEYIFDEIECTMEEWFLKKEAYLYVGDDGWEHFRNEVEWRMEWYILDDKTGNRVYQGTAIDSMFLDKGTFAVCMAVGCFFAVGFAILLYLLKFEEEEEEKRKRHGKILKYAIYISYAIYIVCMLYLYDRK